MVLKLYFRNHFFFGFMYSYFVLYHSEITQKIHGFVSILLEISMVAVVFLFMPSSSFESMSSSIHPFFKG